MHGANCRHGAAQVPRAHSPLEPKYCPLTNASRFLWPPAPGNHRPILSFCCESDCLRCITYVVSYTWYLSRQQFLTKLCVSPRPWILQHPAPVRDYAPCEVAYFGLSVSPGKPCHCAFCRAGLLNSWGRKRVMLQSPHTAAPLLSRVLLWNTPPPLLHHNGRGAVCVSCAPLVSVLPFLPDLAVTTLSRASVTPFFIFRR